MGQLKEILFDCDNTLVLSESLAFEACADLTNEVLESKGIPDRFTGPELLSTFVGYNFRGMLTELQKRYGFSLPDDLLNEYVEREMGEVIKKLDAKAQECEGVTPVLERLFKEKKYGLAIVSSSALPRVVASIKKTNLDHFFPEEHVYSAATSLPTPTSKPNPAIYNYAMEKIGVKPDECIAIEDSRSGATAAKNAHIPLLGYVGPYLEEGKEKQEQVAKMLTEECGAKVIMWHWHEFDKCFEEMKKYFD